MAVTYQARVYYVPTPGQVTYNYGFPKILAEHVKVYHEGVILPKVIDGVTVSYTVNPSSIQLSSAIGSGSELLVIRETPNANMVDFVSGTTLTEQDLDVMAKQSLYLSIEAADFARGIPNLYQDGSGNWDFASNKLINVSTGTADTDAMNKEQGDAITALTVANLTELNKLNGTGGVANDEGESLQRNASGIWDAQAQRIKLAADPTADQDVVTRAFLGAETLRRLDYNGSGASDNFTAAGVQVKNVAAGTDTNDAISKTQLDNYAITGTNLSADLIATTHIQDSAVESAKIANGAITNAKIGLDQVDGKTIADDSIDSEHYADGSIDAAHLASDSVTTEKINGLAVGATEIAAGAVTNAKLGDGAVTAAKVLINSISNDKMLAMPAKTLKGNNAAIGSTQDDLTVAEVQAMLAVGWNLLARAYGRFDTPAGAAHPTTESGFNYDATKTAVGKYTVTFTDAMTDAAYTVTTGYEDTTGTIQVVSIYNVTTTSFEIHVKDGTNSYSDASEFLHFAVHSYQ